ncbi:MAG: ParB N-terminal domain-containing protein, partial [Clostridia bacterium]|nr:ParB N-terminal domain-containing protein [Clostridia bacterium]
MMPKLEINIGRSTLDDLFKSDEGRKTEEIIPMQLSELKPFSEQPFKVLDNEDMDELVESIKINGVLSPIVVRPHP